MGQQSVWLWETPLQKFINPYRVGELPTSATEFYNRENSFVWVEHNFIAQRRLLIVHGAAHIGKSSFLKFLPEKMGISVFPVALAMPAPTGDTAADVLTYFSQQIMFQLAMQDVTPPDISADGDALAALSETLAHVAQTAPDAAVLFTIDDFDALLNTPGVPDTVLNALGALLMRHENFLVALAMNSVSLPQLNHPLLNTAPVHQLPPFDLSTALKFITEPVEKTLRFDYGVPKRIAELTSNHPHYLMLFCHALFNRCAREGWVNLRYVDDTLDDVLAQDIPSFAKMWAEATLVERAVMMAIATFKGSHGVVTRQEITALLSRKNKKVDENIIATALESLAFRGVLVKMGALSYRFFVDLFRHWLAQHYDLGEVLAAVDWRAPANRPEPPTPVAPEMAEDDAAPAETTDESSRPALPKWIAALAALAVLGLIAIGGVFLLGLFPAAAPITAATPSAVATAKPVSFTAKETVVPTFTPTPAPTLTPTPTAPIVVAKSLPSIAYMARQGDGLWQIFVMDTDGTGAHSVSDGTGNDTSPVWSPDGRQLLFVSQRDGNRELYISDIDGGNPRNLTNNPADDWTPAWSPDGQHIAFSSNRTGGWEIFTAAADGSDIRQITDGGSNISPAWSPDGTQIVFSSKRDGNWEIYAMAADGTNLRRLTVNDVNDLAPVWSPDGKMLAYETNIDGNVEIYVMTASGGNPRNISQMPYANDHGPVWSPGGQQLLFYSNRNGDWDLFLTDTAGRSAVDLTNTPDVDEQTPAWRP